MLSILLIVALAVSLSGIVPSADAAFVPGDATLTVARNTVRDDLVPGTYPEPDAEGNPIPLPSHIVLINGEEREVCSVAFVTRDGTDVGPQNSVTGIISQDIGIRIDPLDGFYVSGLTLGAAEGGESMANLLTLANAHLYDTTVTLFLSDFASFDGSGYSLKDEYLSSWGGGSELTLNVTCSRIGDETHSLWYNGGGHNGMIPDTGYADGHGTILTAYMLDNHAYDSDGTVWEFTGYLLEYANGPKMYVEEDDEICLYTDATLTAQWKDVTDQFAAPVPPTVTIVGDSASKEYDGTPLSAQNYTITSGDLGAFTLGVTYNEITEPSSVPNITSYALFNADGSPAFNQADLQASGTFIVDPGTLTVTAKPVPPTVTIVGDSASKEYDGTPLSAQNYTITAGDLGGFTLGVTYNEITEPTTAPNISSYALFNADGSPAFNQTELEASGTFIVDPGTLTVTAAPVLQDLTIRGVQTSADATYEGQSFRAVDFNGGYTAEGLIEGDRIEGEGIVSGEGSSSFDVIINPEAIRIMRGDSDVTGSYNIRVENGYVTVNPYVAPTLQPLTIRGITATVDATSEDQTFSANQIAADGFTNGYQAVGLLEGDTIVDNGIVTASGSSSFDVNVDTTKVQVMRAGQDVTSLYDIHGENGRITVNEFVPAPKPVIPTVTVEAPSASKLFDGTPLTMDAGKDVTEITDEKGITYRIVISYAGGSRTEIGTSENAVTSCVINDVNNQPMFSAEEIQAARDSGQLRVINGTLTVADPAEKQTLVVTGITASVTVKAADQTVTLADCSAEGYKDGYKVTGLLDGHEIKGENIVSGQGTAPGFDTVVNGDAIRVYNGETDVTALYSISAVNGYVTVTVEKPDTPPEPDKPTVPTLTLRGLDASKEYDGTELTMQGDKGYLLSGTIGDYKIAVTYNTITEIGTKPTISSYELQDAQGKTVFTKEDLDKSPNFTVETLGTLTITKPEPTIPKATLTVEPATKEYDGTPLTRENNGNVKIDGDLGAYKLHVVYSSITEPDSVGALANYELTDQNGNVAFTKAQLDASPNFKVNNGKLTITPRPLKLIAISGTLNTKGENIVASSLSTQDGKFVNGYRQEGLMTGHTLSGSFVQGSGKESFKTSIDPEAVRITANGFDVTKCYSIQTQDGYITINAPTTYDLIVNPRSYTWTYDGTAHSMREYDYSGLVNGDKLVKVNFSDQATITNVGNQSNRITSVEVTTATGGDVDMNKYVLISTPGTLTVVQRDLTVTAISGSLTTNGTEVVASSLSTPDGTFKSGFKAEGLVPGHSLTGSFVVGRGTTTFNTSIDLNNLRVVDAYGNDVTRNYSIRTVNGTITINAGASGQQRSNVSLSITAKSGTFPYDGTEHKLNEYTANGLVDGDVIEKVTFKPSSVITDVGTRANEIQTVVIKSANGAAVDNSKYNINYYSGTLTVTKYPLTLTAVSDEKVYDGKALNNKSVKATALANSNHSLSADYEVFDSNGNTIKNGPVDPGVYTKKVSNVKITSGSTDVTANYDITMVDGTLKITGSSGESSRATTTTAYYGNTFTIRSDAPYAEFKYLLIDGAKVPTDNYTVKEGSTIITLKSSYIQSLKSGGHNYTIVSASKQVDGSFNVSKAPKTGDGASMIVWIILLLLAAVAVALMFFFLQRSGKLGGGKRRSGKRNGGKETLRYPSGKEYTRKPVAPVIPDLDFEPEPEPAHDDDPTMDLMKDFDLNLDDYRDPTPKTPSGYTGYTPAGYASEAVSDSGKTGFEAPDFGSFDEPAAPQEEALPDLEVEIFEEEPTASTAAEPEAQPAAEPAEELPEQEVGTPVAEPEPEKAPEPARRRGKHEAPDPSDPFTDSWYQSVGLNKRDKNK
ncbi:MAG: hypothetical protein J6A79_01210 [Clostridia bacterium]|nr:hypothetical protein [Clostridia bacterium]